jgi:arylsulfatase
MGPYTKIVFASLAAIAAATLTTAPALAQQQQRPNIVIIWGDDIGQSNVSAYSLGMMGYKMASASPAASALI